MTYFVERINRIAQELEEMTKEVVRIKTQIKDMEEDRVVVSPKVFEQQIAFLLARLRVQARVIEALTRD